MSGKKILAWAQHINSWLPSLPGSIRASVQLADEATLKFYEQLDGVPDAWVEHALVPKTDEEACFLRECHLADRCGHSESRTGTHADPKVRQM